MLPAGLRAALRAHRVRRVQLSHVVGDFLHGVAGGELHPLRDRGVPRGASERGEDGALCDYVAHGARHQSGVHVRFRRMGGALVHGGEDRRGGGGDGVELRHEAPRAERRTLRRSVFFLRAALDGSAL